MSLCMSSRSSNAAVTSEKSMFSRLSSCLSPPPQMKMWCHTLWMHESIYIAQTLIEINCSSYFVDWYAMKIWSSTKCYPQQDWTLPIPQHQYPQYAHIHSWTPSVKNLPRVRAGMCLLLHESREPGLSCQHQPWISRHHFHHLHRCFCFHQLRGLWYAATKTCFVFVHA